MNLEKNSKIAIVITAIFAVLVFIVLGYVLSQHNSIRNDNEKLRGDISHMINTARPKHQQLRQREESLSVMLSAMSRVNDLSTMADTFNSPAANTMQMHILQVAQDHKLAIRNYSPKRTNISLGTLVYNGGSVAFSAHGDFLPILQFMSTLENTLPLCKIMKTSISPEASIGGKLKANFEVFIPNFKQK